MNSRARVLTAFATAGLAAATLAGCSQSGSQTTTAPTVTAPGFTDRFGFRVMDSGPPNRAGISEIPWVSYWPCYEFYNYGPGKVTASWLFTPVGPAGDTYAVTNNTRVETFAVGGWSLGCGQPTVRDYDSTHLDAARYRVRLDLTYEDGVKGSVEKEAAIVSPPPPIAGFVISEFRLRGPNGAQDFFIELQNTSASTISLGDWVLDVWKPEDPNFVFTTGRFHSLTLGAGCHYLLGALANGTSPLIDGVQVDAWITVPLTENGGIAIRNGIGQVIDQVGMNTASVFKERQPLAPLTGNENRSYVRIGPDTGNNAADFRLVSPSFPQNASMCSAAGQ